MKDQLVSLETAILAKEKGFKEITVYHYGDTRSPMDIMLIAPDDYQGGDNNWKGSNWNDISWSYEKYAASSQSLLQRWLKEKHKIYVNADLSPMTGNFDWFIHDLNITIDDVDKQTFAKLLKESEGFIYTEFEEALEVGLFEALKFVK